MRTEVYLLLTLELSKESSRKEINAALKENGWEKYDHVNTAWWKTYKTKDLVFGEKNAEAEALKVESANLEAIYSKLQIKSSIKSVIQAGAAKPVEV
ncbi:hypothetical protein [Thiomicrospira sp.]|uniref:hypothetical protein n=1 Tax=Thiomicrospira sp. TaxID=935 RepID=UPI002F95E7C7